MSARLRDKLNPGGRSSSRSHHHHREPMETEEEEDKGGGGGSGGNNNGGGGDSDPPTENENPEEQGMEDHKPKNGEAVVGGNGNNRKELFENAKKKAQQDSRRKRRKSAHNVDANYVPPYKKNRFRHMPSVLPSKFLLGGNIRDPLNLASLSDARVSAELNRITPQSSPLPMQFKGDVPVFIPKNPNDPLGLTTKTPENVEDIVAGVRRYSSSRKHRHRKRPGRKRNDSEGSIPAEDEMITKSAKEQPKPVPVAVGGVTQETKQPVAVVEEKEKDDAKKKKEVETAAKQQKKEKEEIKLQQDSKDKVEPASTSVEVKAKETKTKETPKERVGIRTSASSSKAATIETTDKTTLPISGGEAHNERPPSNRSSSEYNPLVNSTYSPSPFMYEGEIYPEVSPYESPFAHFSYTPTHHMQPFSPPPLPELPSFLQRMQTHVQRPKHLSLQRAVFHRPFLRRRSKHKVDPIVSPVIPQPGSSRRRAHPHPHHHGNRPTNNNEPGPSPSKISQQRITAAAGSSGTDAKDDRKKQKDKIFPFGNYNHYYGYRTADQGEPRLWVLKKEYFEGKEVLDIGCNTGHVTLSVARDFEPRRIHGIDIDYSLIAAARKNIRNYVIRDPEDKNIVFPKSLPLIYGVMQPPLASGEQTANVFPYNVSFAHENYVLSSDSLLENVKPQYDVIMCFSVTKWIHLNFGDEGLKRFFKRIFRNLRNEGVLILEPQPWSSYLKKKKLTDKIHQVFQSIKFFPDQFEEYLQNEVGFTSCEDLGTPVHNSKGFQRSILLFKKSEQTKEKEQSSGAHDPYSPVFSIDTTTGTTPDPESNQLSDPPYQPSSSSPQQHY